MSLRTAKDLLHIKRCGTACYMAPEVWDGNTGPPSDVWGLGVVAYIVTSPVLKEILKEYRLLEVYKTYLIK